MEEKDIASRLKTYDHQHTLYEFRPKDFIAYKEGDLWKITFTNAKEMGYELHVKRKTVRTFKSLDALEKCLRKIGVSDFIVSINKKAHTSQDVSAKKILTKQP